MDLILGPEPQGLLVVSYRRGPVVQLHGQRRQAQELPGAVRPLVAPVLLEHVEQIIEFAALPPQLYRRNRPGRRHVPDHPPGCRAGDSSRGPGPHSAAAGVRERP